MRLLVPVLAGILFAANAYPQPAAKQSAGLGKTDPASNQDKNIRAYIELLRSDVQKGKAQIMGVVMQLDSNESAKFWPIYEQFEAGYRAIGDQLVELVKKYAENYDKMTPEVADQLGTKVLDIERQRHELKKDFYQKFKSALGPVTATRFLQVENQLEKLIDLQLAAELPVIE